MLITSRLRLRCLRRRDGYRVVRAALRAVIGRPGFRVIEYSVQSNHIHLICEADDRSSLTRGLQALHIRIARGLNRLLGRSGQVFEDRYHERVLGSPTQARHAIAYVLDNARKHAAQRGRRLPRRWLDPFSSAAAFVGLERDEAISEPETWLLRGGWRRSGRIDILAFGALRPG